MTHANAPLTPVGRLRLARCVVDDGWPLRSAARRFQVSATTAKRWADRYRSHGEAGMTDRSSRPHHSPARTPVLVEQHVLDLRRRHRIGPVRLGARADIAASTAHRILLRHGMPRLACLDRATGRIVRYERDRPGELLHVDVKKLGRIPDGGGHRTIGRAAGRRNRRRGGYAFIHTAVDDHSRLAYSEVLSDETAKTCAAFLTRAAAWYACHGITIERVLTDNAWAYTKTTWRNTCHMLGIQPRHTRPWRPQTNGKVERFHRTLTEEWAYAQPYTTETQRLNAYPDWLDWYNYHRPHTALGGLPPASRVTNLPGQHT